MAEGSPVEDLVLEEVKRDCSSGYCPYRAGDGESQVVSLKTKVRNRLRFRVAWGHEVRLLERKFNKLRKGIESVIASTKEVGAVTMSDIRRLEKLLADTIHDPVEERYDPEKKVG